MCQRYCRACVCCQGLGGEEGSACVWALTQAARGRTECTHGLACAAEQKPGTHALRKCMRTHIHTAQLSMWQSSDDLGGGTQPHGEEGGPTSTGTAPLKRAWWDEAESGEDNDAIF